MNEKSLLKKTDQFRVLVYGMSSMLIGGLIMVAGFFSMNSLSDSIVVMLIMYGALHVVASFVVTISLIRCPHCGTRLAWHAVKSKNSSDWLGYLLSLEHCPVCKDKGK